MIPIAARPTNRIVAPVCGKTIVCPIKYAPTTADMTISAQSNNERSRIIADDSADDECDARITRAFGDKCRDQRHRQFSAGQKSGNRDRDFLQEQREQRADEPEHERHAQL